MTGILRTATLGLFSLLLISSAWADVPPPSGPFRPRPRPQPVEPAPSKITAPVVVKHADLAEDGERVQAKIAIPRKLLAKLAGDVAAPAAAPAVVPEKQSSVGSPRSIIAGVVLSLAAVSLVFVARGSKVAKATAAVGLIAGLVLAGSSLMADIRVPGQPYRGPARRPDIDDPMPVPPEATQVVLEVVDDADSVVLTLPSK